MMESLFKLFPATEFSLLAVVLGMPLLGAFVNGVFGKRLGREAVRLMALSALGASFLAAVVSFAMLVHQANASEDHEHAARLTWNLWTWMSLSLRDGIGATTIDVAFMVDPLNGVMMLVITGVGFLIHLYATAYMWEDPSFHRFFAYLNLFVFAMLVLVLGSSLPLLFVGWEGVGLCSYLLIGFWFTQEKNAAAGKKAFIANRIGDFGLLLGMGLLLYWTGSLDFIGMHGGAEGLLTKVQIWPLGAGLPSILKFMEPAQPVEVYASTLCGLCLFLGCAGKSAQIPLYVWLPDAMAGPTPVSALIHAATMVTAGVYLVCRLSYVFVLSPAAMTTIAVIGGATAIFAATIGLVQHDIKKVLAYSTVSQLGYMFLGVGMGAFSDGFFHVFTHAFFKACLFLGAGSVIHAMHVTVHDDDHSQDMRNMGGLRRYMPITHATYLISCLAIAGVPLFSGFFSKDEILGKTYETLVEAPQLRGEPLWTAPHWLGHVLFAVGITAALMTSFYMFRTYYLTFWGEFKGWKIVPGFAGGHHAPAHAHETDEDHAHAHSIEASAHDQTGEIDGHGHGHDAHGDEEEHAHHGPTYEPGVGYEHLEGDAPHESPWQMTLPLAVLAFMAIASGYLNAKLLAETFHTEKLAWLDHWLEPVFAGSTETIKVPTESVATIWELAIPGIVVAFAGWALAYWVYQMKDGKPADELAEKVPGLHQLVLDKWRIDKLYDDTVIGAIDELAQTAAIFDKWVVDGVLAKLTSFLVAGLGTILRLTQTGRVQVYGAAIALGTVLVGGWFYLPHADVTIAPDGEKMKLTAGVGVGYKYRWDSNGDGNPDTAEFGETNIVEVPIEAGKTQNVTLEVENAFRRRSRRTFAVTRPKREEGPPSGMNLDDLLKQLPQGEEDDQ